MARLALSLIAPCLIVLFLLANYSKINTINNSMGLRRLRHKVTYRVQEHLEKKSEDTPQWHASSNSAQPLIPPVNCTEPGYKSVVYFCSWAIYDRNHFPQDLPLERLTHILYAFCNVDPVTGLVKLDDDWAGTGTMARRGETGCGDGVFGELYKLKQQHRHLKVLLSIGGWTYSASMKAVINDSAKRQEMAVSLVELVTKLSLDGIDVDWEYAENKEEAQNYVDLLRLLRQELDKTAQCLELPSDQFDLSVATPAGPCQRVNLDIAGMDEYLTFWNLMTYDFSGPWTQTAEYQSNLFNGIISAADVVDFYVRSGATPGKLVLGMPVYGRAFANATSVGSKYSGVVAGTWEQGIYDYKLLPLQNAEESVDYNCVSAYCFNKEDGILVCYDNAVTSRLKAKYVKDKHLGGGMWWESSADHPVGNERSLIGAFTEELGVNRLERKMNNLLLED